MPSYEDVGKIGTGGFATVWVCARTTDGTRFAKKILLRVDDAEAARRFKREVRILSRLDHPNIVKILTKQLDEQPYYYIMPLYSGSLRAEMPRILRDEGRIYRVFSALLDAMEYAHAQGIIHRDLKPENVLMNSDADIAVSDFGLGRVVDAESTRVTQSGQMMGTPFYMAPEQLLNAKAADARADVFAMGRLLYEMYTGPLTSSVQDLTLIPQGIAMLVSRCTALDPGRRFQSVGELKQAWHAHFDPQILESDLDQVATLRSDLSIADEVDGAKAARLLDLLCRHQDNLDLLHETLMQLHKTALAAMHDANPALASQLFSRFLDFVAGQAWPFDYTDRIASHCAGLYEAVVDFELRARILKALLVLAVTHNRWHVYGVFARLLQEEKVPGEQIPVVEQLSTLDTSTRRSAAGWLRIHDLHPSIRPLFDFPEAPF